MVKLQPTDDSVRHSPYATSTRADAAGTTPGDELIGDSNALLRLAMRSLFEQLNGLCEGAIATDAQARVVWISDKYLATLGLTNAQQALGHEIEEIIPNSLMREVVKIGQPIFLDIMGFGEQSLVVTRLPIKDGGGRVLGAIGFVLYDHVHYLKPLVAKFARLQQELADAQRRLVENRRPRYTLSNFVGTSPASVEVKRQARRAAQQDTTVLLLGETGTGKEMLAHAIHAASDRFRKPFIAVNVAAVPESLLEVEFFGAAPGAYTGADKKARDGKFKVAHGGTLFLDEIGDMPLPLQSKLLRVLQDGEVEPVGSDRMFRVDIRVIAATSLDLLKLVREGRFRADLYYRLNVLPIVLTPLRERLADLEALCERFMEQIALRTGSPQREVTAGAIAALAAYDWPGNVRELGNVLERATMLTDSPRLTGDDFATMLPPRSSTTVGGSHAIRSYADALADFDRATFQSALSATGGNVQKAARLLGLSRATLYKRLARLGIASQDRDAGLTA